MRKNFGSQPWLYPQPVLIIATYDINGTPNAMNAAWGGISGDNNISICLSSGHKTVQNALETGAFTVSPAQKDCVKACDYVGIETANTCPDKIKKAGFHVVKSEFVNAPIIEELKMTLECKVITYNEETQILRGEIVNVSACDSVLTDGKIDVTKLKPITFDAVNSTYIALGEKCGNAFCDGDTLK